ncbi:MAG: cytochrome c family protein [Hyphomonadaceae bacterium]|nr:cytochrome c family protein [Hyphomonadaceae bacterium]
MRIAIAAAVAVTLALGACGQSSEPASAPAPAAQATAPQPAAAPGPSAEELQALVAALPAPLNEGNYENGRRVFAQCRSCHVVEKGGGNRVGPNLHDTYGHPSGRAPDFRYSPAMANAGVTWDFATLDRYLTRPRDVVPGTLMVFAGLRKPEDRRDVIAYIAAESQR